MGDVVRLGLIQHACGPDPQENLRTCIELIREAAGRGATLIATQELFTSTYFCQEEDERHFDLAQPIPGPTSEQLVALAGELEVTISASLFERRAAGVYHNTSIMIDRSQGILARYRKMHIPDDPMFYEKFYFTPGDAPTADEPGWRVVPTRDIQAGMLICWDQWFPEAARLTALRGAQVLFYPTAIAWCGNEPHDEQQRQRDAWITMQRSHAIANGVYVAAINRVGVEGELTFWGTSLVVDPGGQVIAEAPIDGPAALVVDCDLKRIDKVRRMWPFLRDRRIDSYHDLTRRLID